MDRLGDGSGALCAEQCCGRPTSGDRGAAAFQLHAVRAPVTAEFSVQGFDKLAGLVGNTCGWKLEESRPQPDRNAKLTRR